VNERLKELRNLASILSEKAITKQEYELFLNAVPIAFCIVRKDLTIRFQNKSAKKLLGKSIIDFLSLIDDQLHHSFIGVTSNPDNVSIKTANGEKVVLQIEINPVWNTDKEVEYAIITFSTD
jgi:PAS domain-containing protein